jgi:hypothetical protein
VEPNLGYVVRPCSKKKRKKSSTFAPNPLDNAVNMKKEILTAISN